MSFHTLTHMNESHRTCRYSNSFFFVVAFRFLVHRYSVMREHVEANKIEGVDDIDSHYMETGKVQYNEDSDQVFIFSLLV